MLKYTRKLTINTLKGDKMNNLSNSDDIVSNLHSSQSKSISSALGLEDTPTLAEQIKAARQRMGLSQRAFADKIGLTQTQLCRLENNSGTRPTRKTLKALSPFLSKSYSDLLVESGYSGIVSPQEEYYSFSGDAIDAKEIVEEIFQTDPDFLEYLKNFSQYGTSENISVLKIIIQTMKITESEGHDNTLILLKEHFKYLKKYILGILSISSN